VEGRFKNRYDVTILINGLPLVQIELKRRGLELKEAFNQINRYEHHSYGAGEGLFQYIQMFVISNGVNTKYYANGRVDQRSFKQTFYWTNKKNKPVPQLSIFAEQFLEKCHLAKMVTRFLGCFFRTRTRTRTLKSLFPTISTLVFGDSRVRVRVPSTISTSRTSNSFRMGSSQCP